MFRPMRALALGALGVAVLAGVAAPAAADGLPASAVRVVDYRISVKLDPVTKQLDGHEHLTWRNPSTEPVGDLWFHLYLNAFKNSSSTFFRESGGQLRGDTASETGWGWIDITCLRFNGGGDVKERGRFEHPDDGNVDDQTVWRLPLEQPVPPGGSVTLDIDFKAQLPRVFARTGYAGDYFLVGQWFPKLGVYEPAGMRGRETGGWNCHQFHANSEFYADFGTFHVEITLPSRFIVGATGVRTAETSGPDGTKTYTYEQADIHDFAWTADPRFVEVRRKFSASEDVSATEYEQAARRLGRPLDEVRLSDVEIILLIHEERRPQIERHIRAAKAGLKYYGLWYGRYPYQTLTVVDPAPGALGSGGMEYPTFITAGTTALFNYWPFTGLRVAPEMVTVHEFGHQFWYAMVANNEFEEPWLDEGINSYSTGRVMEAEYGLRSAMASMPLLDVSASDFLRLQNNPDQKFNVILKPAWAYTSDYSFYAYTKPEIVLRTLENYLGRDTWARVMRTYHERWRFRHPSSSDFFAVVNEVSGQDMGWFLRPAILGNEVLDYEISSVSATAVARPRGVFEEGGNKVTRKRSDGRPDAGEKRSYVNRVTVSRRGDMVMPIEIDLKFEGKPVERVTWDGRDTFKRFEFTRPERLEWANVDPERKLEMDVDWLNNARRLEPDTRVRRKLTGSLMFFVQAVLAWLAA